MRNKDFDNQPSLSAQDTNGKKTLNLCNFELEKGSFKLPPDTPNMNVNLGCILEIHLLPTVSRNPNDQYFMQQVLLVPL